MGIFGQQSVDCPHCGQRFEATAVRSMYEGGERSLRDEVLSGQAQLHDCPACANPVRVEPTMLYADIDRQQWYAVFPDSALIHRTDLTMMVRDVFHRHMEVFCPPEVAAWAPSLRKRLVFGLASLREKLICDDAGIDDRVLEVLKLQVARDLVPEAFAPDALIYATGIDDETITLAIETPPARKDDRTHTLQRWSVERQDIDTLIARGDLSERFPAMWNGWVVDWRAPLHPDLPLPPNDAVDEKLFERTF